MKLRRLAIVALVAVLALTVLVVLGCSGSSSTPATGGSSGGATTGGTSSGGMTVTMQNFAFNPNVFTVSVGEAVTFENKDSAPHTVNINGVDSGDVAPGATFKWTPTTAGTFPLKCSIHPQMTGTITVK